MKIAVVLGLVLAMVFAAILLTPLFDLSDQGEAISGLDAPALSFFNTVSNLGVLLVSLIGVAFIITAFTLLVKNR